MTKTKGEERKLRDTRATIKTCKEPHSFSVLVINPAGPIDETLEIVIKFKKVNYKIEGMKEEVDEVKKVV